MPILEPPYGIVLCGLDFHPRALSVAISGGVSRKRGARNDHRNELDSAGVGSPMEIYSSAVVR
jgi:hypothetical protein